MPVASRPLALVAAAFALALSLTGQQHLRFLHISDTHLPREASERYVRELMDRTDAAEVAFSIHTGDITEFGGRRDAWPAYLALFDGSKLPHYDALGNHDQTWDGLADRLRAHFGAAYYRFENHGVTFFCLNSATAQDPRPSYGEEQLRWLERELSKLPADARVALFQHHPPDSDEFATPYETQRIYAMLAGRDVLALFVGHGHAARSGTAGAWRWVMGGSTFGGNTGHGTCDVEGRKVRYVYDYLDPKKKSVTLLDEEQPGFSPFSLALDVTPREGGLQARLRAAGEGAPALKGLRAYLDFDEKVVVRGAREVDVPIVDLVPGVHVLTVEAERADGRVHHLLHEFEVPEGADARLQRVWGCRLPEAVQGPMAIDDGLLVVAGNAGTVYARDMATGVPRWQFELDGPAPGGVVRDGHGGFVVGTLEGTLVRLDRSGQPSWRAEVGEAVAAAPFVHGDLVVAVDLGGNGHAFAARNGEERWHRKLAAYAIEKPPVPLDDRRALVGAWDTRVHAFELADGSEAWSERGKGARAKAARYYSPADCPPVVQDGKAFVVDRSFALMFLDLQGNELPGGLEQVASVAGDPAAHHVYLRRCTGAVTCLDSRDLSVVWDRELPVGRTPTPLTGAGGLVFAIGERDGVLSVLDAATGERIDRRRVNAGCYPFCPVAWGQGFAVVGGMDGRVVALRLRR